MRLLKIFRILFGFAVAIVAATFTLHLVTTSSIEGFFSAKKLGPFTFVAIWAMCHYIPLYVMLLAARWTSMYHIVGMAYILSVVHNLIAATLPTWSKGLPIDSSAVALRDIGSVSITTGCFALWLIAHADYSKLCTWAKKHVLGNAVRILSACWHGCRAMGGRIVVFSDSSLSERWEAFPHYGNYALRTLVGFAMAICAAVVYKSLFLVAVDNSARESGFLVNHIPAWFIEISIVTLAVYLPLYLVALMGQWTNVHHIVVWPYAINNSVIGLAFSLLDTNTSVAVIPHEIIDKVNTDELSGLSVILSKAWVIAGAFVFWLVMHANHSKLRACIRENVAKYTTSMQQSIQHGSRPTAKGFAGQSDHYLSLGELNNNSGMPRPLTRIKRAFWLVMLGLLLYLSGAVLYMILPHSAIMWYIKATFI